MRVLIISDNEAGQRLDKLLLKYMNLAGKSFIYKMIRKKNITLNGKKCDGSEKLTTGDEIKLFLSDDTIDKFSEIKIQEVSEKKLDIIYEDNNIIIINKPAGMLSQKAKDTDESLVEHIISYMLMSGEISKEGLRSFRPSVCNRLDRNTSGIITAGKSLAGLQTLSSIFKDRSIHKYYLCIVSGRMQDEKLIEGYLAKDENCNRVSIYKEYVDGALPIKTQYQPLASNSMYSVLKVTLFTGRSHQIRAHLASIGYPIVGDIKYGDERVNKEAFGKYHIRHQLLHSYKLILPDIDGELSYLSGKEFTAEPPDDFLNMQKHEGL